MTNREKAQALRVAQDLLRDAFPEIAEALNDPLGIEVWAGDLFIGPHKPFADQLLDLVAGTLRDFDEPDFLRIAMRGPEAPITPDNPISFHLGGE